MSADTGGVNTELANSQCLDHEKRFDDSEHHEDANASLGNLVYDNDELEPELHMRTYVALAAMFVLNYVGIVALQGPPSVVSDWKWTRQ